MVYPTTVSSRFLSIKGTGRGGGRKKRNNRGHGGSRRGSVSSEAGTPVPDSSWTNEPTRFFRPDEKSGTTSIEGHSAGPSRSRHTSSPQSNQNRNGVPERTEVPSAAVNPVSPTPFLCPAPVMSPPPPSSGYRQSSEPPVHSAFQQVCLLSIVLNNLNAY